MTLKSHVEQVNPGDNVIIGLGDSFTQGVGAYSNETWATFNKPASMHNITGQMHIDEQGKNNWVRQLRDTFYPDYKIMNLGVNGAGNRAAVKELYLNKHLLPSDVGNVIVILMSTGIDRFDFLKNEIVTAGPENHQKWLTIWPVAKSTRGGPTALLEETYSKSVWSNKTSLVEYLLNVADAQTFCHANGYNFFFASAFDLMINKQIMLDALDEYRHVVDIVDWDHFIKPDEDAHFMDYICRLEGNPNFNEFLQAAPYLHTLDMPLQYVTPCAHWSKEGNIEVAKLLNKLLIENGVS